MSGARKESIEHNSGKQPPMPPKKSQVCNCTLAPLRRSVRTRGSRLDVLRKLGFRLTNGSAAGVSHRPPPMESENPAWGRKRVSPLAMRLPETLRCRIIKVTNIESGAPPESTFQLAPSYSVLGPNDFVTSSTTLATTADRTGPEPRRSNSSVALKRATENPTSRTEAGQ